MMYSFKHFWWSGQMKILCPLNISHTWNILKHFNTVLHTCMHVHICLKKNQQPLYTFRLSCFRVDHHFHIVYFSILWKSILQTLFICVKWHISVMVMKSQDILQSFYNWFFLNFLLTWEKFIDLSTFKYLPDEHCPTFSNIIFMMNNPWKLQWKLCKSF